MSAYVILSSLDSCSGQAGCSSQWCSPLADGCSCQSWSDHALRGMLRCPAALLACFAVLLAGCAALPCSLALLPCSPTVLPRLLDVLCCHARCLCCPAYAVLLHAFEVLKRSVAHEVTLGQVGSGFYLFLLSENTSMKSKVFVLSDEDPLQRPRGKIIRMPLCTCTTRISATVPRTPYRYAVL